MPFEGSRTCNYAAHVCLPILFWVCAGREAFVRDSCVAHSWRKSSGRAGRGRYAGPSSVIDGQKLEQEHGLRIWKLSRACFIFSRWLSLSVSPSLALPLFVFLSPSLSLLLPLLAQSSSPSCIALTRSLSRPLSLCICVCLSLSLSLSLLFFLFT